MENLRFWDKFEFHDFIEFFHISKTWNFLENFKFMKFIRIFMTKFYKGHEKKL